MRLDLIVVSIEGRLRAPRLPFYDWWVSRHIGGLMPKAVVAYENAACHTFRQAKELGARCILDAPSLHHEAQARLMPSMTAPHLREINRRKDEEIGLAD